MRASSMSSRKKNLESEKRSQQDVSLGAGAHPASGAPDATGMPQTLQ
jgi:hypothetical protein